MMKRAIITFILTIKCVSSDLPKLVSDVELLVGEGTRPEELPFNNTCIPKDTRLMQFVFTSAVAVSEWINTEILLYRYRIKDRIQHGTRFTPEVDITDVQDIIYLHQTQNRHTIKSVVEIKLGKKNIEDEIQLQKAYLPELKLQIKKAHEKTTTPQFKEKLLKNRIKEIFENEILLKYFNEDLYEFWKSVFDEETLKTIETVDESILAWAITYCLSNKPEVYLKYITYSYTKRYKQIIGNISIRNHVSIYGDNTNPIIVEENIKMLLEVYEKKYPHEFKVKFIDGIFSSGEVNDEDMSRSRLYTIEPEPLTKTELALISTNNKLYHKDAAEHTAKIQFVYKLLHASIKTDIALLNESYKRIRDAFGTNPSNDNEMSIKNSGEAIENAPTVESFIDDISAYLKLLRAFNIFDKAFGDTIKEITETVADVLQTISTAGRQIEIFEILNNKTQAFRFKVQFKDFREQVMYSIYTEYYILHGFDLQTIDADKLDLPHYDERASQLTDSCSSVSGIQTNKVSRRTLLYIILVSVLILILVLFVYKYMLSNRQSIL